MAERLNEQNESLEALKDAEQLKAPERHETSTEHSQEKQHEQLETARHKLEQAPEPAAKASEHDHRPSHHPTTLDKEAAYHDTLRSLQRHLSPASRRFSKVIHSPAVEKTSEVVGATVARPSVTLGATTTALIVGGFLYFTARAYGFALSGSELLLSLIIGGILGLLVEGVAKLFKRA